MQSEILFSILAFLSVLSAFLMIYSHRPIDSALSFIITLISIAALFALLGSSFLFAIEIIIYAGAILTLILFIIMFLNIKDENLPEEKHKNIWILVTSLLISPFSYLLINVISSIDYSLHVEPNPHFGEIKSIGMLLYTKWVLPFELLSVLLLVSLLGAIILARKEKSHD